MRRWGGGGRLYPKLTDVCAGGGAGGGRGVYPKLSAVCVQGGGRGDYVLWMGIAS